MSSDRPPDRTPGGEHGWGRFDDESSGDAGRPPAEEPFYTLGFGTMLSSVTWIGLLGGPILLVWGSVWLGLGRPLGWALVLLGVLILVATIVPMVRKLRARRRPPR
ncbi:hypothetical protein [Naasia sp. SYSU D00057]|uniref:hypothetical protein n=1 Tax=Naasia sp. SYSU D00057 TaxID=2817380 RepID=UPI001B303588|nr:hypothetical protein [Naasia sp. SYSU D00057]